MNSILRSVLREDQIICPPSKKDTSVYTPESDAFITPFKNNPAEISKPLQCEEILPENLLQNAKHHQRCSARDT